MAGLKFDITGDNGNMLSALQGVQNGVRQTQRVVEQSGHSIEQLFGKIQSAAAGIATAFSAKELVSKVLEVRGEFQQLEVAFSTMLGSAEEANSLMDQLVKTAATTPFDLKSVSEGAKQLLAYGTQANEVNETLIRLGDIAAGLSIPLNDLVYLYGTTMTQGRMFTQDLRQFQGRGIPIADELAKIFGTTKDKVGELVTAGKVGAAEVQQAIENMTNAGGRFGGLMEAQSHTITGQISNIEDAIDSMFNDIGKANEGVINDALGGVSYLVEHWKEIAQIVLNVASAYGVAKAAVVAWSVYQKIHNLLMEKAAVQMALAKAEGIALSEAEAVASVATMGFSSALNSLKVAIASNPVGVLAVALTAVFTAMQLLDDETNAAAIESTKYGDSAAKSIQKVRSLSDEVKGLSDSNKVVTTSTKLSKDVLEELNKVLEQNGVARIKEGDKIDIVNKKRELAISLIKEEAIERQRLNNIDAGNQAYEEEIKAAKDELFKNFSKATFRDSNDSGMSDKIMQMIFGDADKVRENARLLTNIFSDTVEQFAPTLAQKTGNAYKAEMAKMFAELKMKMKSVGFSDKEIKEIFSKLGDGGWFANVQFIQKYIDRVRDAATQNYNFKKSTDAVAAAEKKAADKTLTFSDRVAGISRALQGPNDGVHQLYKNIQRLMEKYKKNTIGFEIIFSGKVPSWMDKMGIPQLSALAKRFTALGESLKKGQTMNVNGKTFTKEQLLQKGADYASAAEAKQKKADAAKGSNNEGKTNPIADQKKNLQAQLNSLSYKDAIGRKGKELRKKIRDLQVKEKAYSASYETDASKEAERKRKDAAKEAEKAAEDAKKAAEQQNEANERAFELKTKTQIENARKAEDLANETEQAEIDILKDGNEKKLRQIELNHKKEQQAIDRAFEDIKQHRIEQAKQAWEANPKNKGKNFYESTSYSYASSDERYTIEEHTNYDSKTKAAWHKYDEEVKKIQEEEKSANEKRALSIISYLKEYGTMQEKRLAIAKEYDAKIVKADTEGDRLSLNAQKAKALADFDLKNEKDNLNWDEIFGDIGNQTIKQLEVVKSRLREMLSSDNLNVTDYKAIVEQIEKVNNAIVDSQDKQKKFFNFSTDHGKERRKLEMDVADALERQASAAGRVSVATLRNMEKQRNARQSVENAGVKVDGDISTANIDNILKQIEDKYGKDSAQYKEVQKAMDALAASERDLINANEQKKKSDNDVSKSQGKLNKFINDFNENMKAFMSAFSLVLNNLNDLPDLLSKFGVSDDSDLMKGAKEIVTAGKEGMQAIKDFQSGNFVGAAAHGMESAGAIGRAAITLFGGSGNEAAMEKEIERLAKANEGLSKAIDTLSNNIEKKDNTNSQSVDAYKKAKKAEEEWESNQRKAINNRAKEYANTGYGFLKLGGRSSFNAFANENKKIWTSFNATLQSLGSDKRVSRAEDLWNLSPELLKQLQANNNTAWRELFNNKGHKNPKELVDEYIERAGKAEELADKLNEKLTGYSWDGFKDSYLSALEDMESDTETFANNINNVIGKAILNSLVNSSDIQERIKKIHKMIADAAVDDNFTENEVDAIRKENSSLSDILLQRRESLKAMGLLVDSNESQKATANGVTSITFEQASNIIALTTAGNISRDQIKELVTSIMANIAYMYSLSSSTNTTIIEIRNLMLANNSYLEDILKCSKSMYNDFSLKIDKVNKNLEDLK